MNNGARGAVAICLTLFGLVACDADGQRAAQPSPPAAAVVSRDSAATGDPYRVVTVAAGGRITGRVTIDGRPRRDTVVASTADQSWCGAAPRVKLVEGSGDRVAGAVVWIQDLRAGKPLPLVRRYDLIISRCAAQPMVLAAVAGGMLDVRNRDPIEHRTRFLSGASTLDVVDESDAGQVVPAAAVLAHPGLVEVRCDLHPATHGWIRVFDHPYFAVTGRDGAFRIDSVPPGTYRLAVWQPALGERDVTVKVEAGRAADVRVALPAQH